MKSYLKKFNEMKINENISISDNTQKYKEFLNKMDNKLQDLFNGGTTNISLKVGDEVLEIEAHADNWDIVVEFINKLIEEEEDYINN